MELKNIELINFRNYKYQKIEFINGINLFNGKTPFFEKVLKHHSYIFIDSSLVES